MTDLSGSPRARLFTVFGTVLYVDEASGRLRHGPVETSPANAVFVAKPGRGRPRQHRKGRLMHDKGDSLEPIACLPDQCRTVSSMEKGGNSAAGTLLELVPLERGLIAVKGGTAFLCAEPQGAITLSKVKCSTWECFLASENWCTDGADDEQLLLTGDDKFDTKKIQSYLVHPLIRKRVNARSTATKVLIYGYPQWSHGRVYYDLCKQLHRRGYIVDIINWQENHSAYFADLISFYDLFMTALDGVRTLTDTYGVPYDRVVALSHHELDIRMLIEQKGVEIFDKFANYGVVSEYVYCASLMKGVPRVPKVVPLGVDFAEFYSEISERLATVGYAGSMSATTYGIEWKRGELAEAAAREAGLEFRAAGWTGNQISFHDMPEFYQSVDAVLISSISESGPLPVMEAAAAGRLVIGTPVGHFPRKAYEGGGILAPIEAGEFKAFTAETLRYYKDNPAAYRDKCHAIQEAAKRFDWKYTIDAWVDLIEGRRSELAPEEAGRTLELGNAPPLPRGPASSLNTRSLGQVHVINLDRSADRLAKFRDRNPFLDFVRVSAVDGALVDRSPLVKDGIISEDLTYAAGSLGCALSHIGLWKKAAEEKRIVTIFEDDVVGSRYFHEESEDVLARLPEQWDLVQWGANFYPLFMWVDFGFSKAKLQFYDRAYSEDVVAFQNTRRSPSPMRIAHSFGAMAYSVSPKGARALIDYCLPLRKRHITFPEAGVTISDTGIDCPMCGAYGSMEAFVCLPPLVIHDDEAISDRIAAGG